MIEEFERICSSLRGERIERAEMIELRNEYEKLLKTYKSELLLRRSLHNKLQELKGNIRVMCRVRPFLNHEMRLKRKTSSTIKIAN